MGQTAFAIGRRWRCERPDKPTFDFVVVAKGHRAGYKECRVESPKLPGQGIVQEYSHAHLKKCARLLPIDSE